MKKREWFFKMKSVQLGEKKQGLIYYFSRNYYDLPDKKRTIIDAHIQKCGGENADALKKYMTTPENVLQICMDENIASPSTIYALVKRYYETFPLKEIIN